MYTYLIDGRLAPLDRPPQAGEAGLVLLTSAELAQSTPLPGLESVLHHIPPARDVRVCKAEVRRDCLCGTILTPRSAKSGAPIAFGYLLTGDRVVICDDTGRPMP